MRILDILILPLESKAVLLKEVLIDHQRIFKCRF